MPDFSIPLSGLDASSTALSTISNNLANLNTTGYKDTSVNFQDMFYQLMGSNGAGDLLQVGAGTSVASIGTNFSGGSVQNTGVTTDAAITGNGFFIVQNGASTYYTRAGDFTQDSNGYLVTADGYQVIGYPAVSGVVNSSGALAPIQVQDGMVNPPQATSTMSIAANLSSDAAVGDSYSVNTTIYDSLGTSHVLTVDFTRTATGWSYNATLPASDLTAGSATTVASGNLSFDGNGNLTSTAPVAINISNLANGASNMNVNWELASSGQGLITQLSGASSTSATTQDGYGSGTLTGFTINSDGTIIGSFTNGTKALGQIALANFANLQGLSKQGDNNFAATMSSGSAVVGAPGTSSLGTLTGGALENSNVDMSTEFSNLIIAERGYQANAKSVTTFDQIAQDTINMIR
jgi:flagellar hook protein FlgE